MARNAVRNPSAEPLVLSSERTILRQDRSPVHTGLHQTLGTASIVDDRNYDSCRCLLAAKRVAYWIADSIDERSDERVTPSSPMSMKSWWADIRDADLKTTINSEWRLGHCYYSNGRNMLAVYCFMRLSTYYKQVAYW